MAITTSGTTLTFNDATTQTTAPVNTNANVASATAVAGTGISVTAVTTTGAATHTITNTGVTSAVAGTGITVSGATGAVTISSTATGTVTSVATGNGLSGGTITGSGTLVVAAPAWQTVGSYIGGNRIGVGQNANTSYAGSSIQVQNSNGSTAYQTQTGTWLCLGATSPTDGNCLFVRTS
jgi:hypothetical protein